MARTTDARVVPDSIAWGALFAAWLIALVATVGALFIGEVMGRPPCTLCWFQRIFVFPLAVILGIAAYMSDFRVWMYALPVAAIGWLVAGYHLLVYYGLVSPELQPCTAGPSCADDVNLLGVVPIPALSLAALTGIVTLLLILRRRLAA